MRRWKDNVDCFQPKQDDIEGLQRGYVGQTEPESRPDDAATAVDQRASHGLEERLQLDHVAIGGFDVVIERQDQQCGCPVTRNSLPLGVCVSRCCHGLMGLALVYLSEVMEEELSNGGMIGADSSIKRRSLALERGQAFHQHQPTSRANNKSQESSQPSK